MADPPVSTPQSTPQPDPPATEGTSVPDGAAAPDSSPSPVAAVTPDATPAESAQIDSTPPAPSAAAPEEASSEDQAAIEELLKQANFEDPSAVTSLPAAPEAAALDLPNFQQVIRDAQVSSIDLLRDVELNVKIELGRSRMLVEDVLKLGEGSVVELDKLAGDPVDVFVNDRLVARGEVLVLNDNFCVRVNEIVAGLREETP